MNRRLMYVGALVAAGWLYATASDAHEGHSPKLPEMKDVIAFRTYLMENIGDNAKEMNDKVKAGKIKQAKINAQAIALHFDCVALAELSQHEARDVLTPPALSWRTEDNRDKQRSWCFHHGSPWVVCVKDNTVASLHSMPSPFLSFREERFAMLPDGGWLAADCGVQEATGNFLGWMKGESNCASARIPIHQILLPLLHRR